MPLPNRSQFILILLMLSVTTTFGITTKADLANLSEGDRLSSFSVINLWENELGEPIGARLVDARYGFIVDLLVIQSVPQGFFWVKTPPKWDKGEPHTCEHLVLGKCLTSAPLG